MNTHAHHGSGRSTSITLGAAGAAASVLVGVLLAAVAGPAATGAPAGHPVEPQPPAVATSGGFVEKPCFATPHVWSDSLAGPLPRCYRYVL